MVGLVRDHTQDTGPLSDVSSNLHTHGPKTVTIQLMVVQKLMMVTGNRLTQLWFSREDHVLLRFKPLMRLSGLTQSGL